MSDVIRLPGWAERFYRDLELRVNSIRALYKAYYRGR